MTGAARTITVRWVTPAPSAIEEVLAVYDDGWAYLAVRAPRAGATVGVFRARITAEELTALGGLGPQTVIDLLHPGAEPSSGIGAAERLADRLRSAPAATVTFHAGATAAGPDPATGPFTASLVAVGGGERPVEFELDPGNGSVHFGRDGATLAWFELPDLATGFIAADATGLGGLGRRAEVAPGSYGAIAFDVAAPGVTGATDVSIHIGGWLHGSLPDEDEPARFFVRTDPTPIRGR